MVFAIDRADRCNACVLPLCYTLCYNFCMLKGYLQPLIFFTIAGAGMQPGSNSSCSLYASSAQLVCGVT
jgi:hypothetical protein